MAKSANQCVVGDYVYEPFAILKPGKVIAVHNIVRNGYPERHLEVRWLDGSVTKVWELHLNDFNHATDEHLKKYNKFDAIRKTLAKI